MRASPLAPLDDGRYGPVEGRIGAPEGTRVRCGEAVRSEDPEAAQSVVKRLGGGLDRRRDQRRLLVEVGPEQAARDHVERQSGEVVDQPALLAVGPALGRRRGAGAHRRGVAGDPSSMKRRLYQSPVAAPARPFAGEQSVADDQPQPMRRQALLEGPLLRDQHLFDRPWVGQQQHRERAEAQPGVAVSSADGQQVAERVALERAAMPEQQVPGRAAESARRWLWALERGHRSVG